MIHREFSLVLCDVLDGWDGGGWEDSLRERVDMYTCNRLTSFYFIELLPILEKDLFWGYITLSPAL